jgi:hypothetical protein
MKHVDLFKDFLTDTVNLNDTRVTDLETSIEAVKNAVRDSDWEPHISGWMAHGSWAHKTIIRPVDNGEFDADLIVFVEHVSGWTAATYIETLYDAFRENTTYKSMVSRSSHCVTISYANDKKIDIAPCLTNRTAFRQLEVCNRTTDQFERSEPRQYTDWLIERNGYSGGNTFRKVTRLIKYLRDIKTRFTCSSVLLTTILGYRISAADKDSDVFADTPIALKTVFGRMDDWLQANPSKPSIANPFLSTENFADVWTTEHYENFRDKIHTYREWIDDAFDEADRTESIAKWRRVFGEDFATGVVTEEAKSVSKSAVALLKSSVSTAALFTGDLVEAFKQYGSRAIPPRFHKQAHMHTPTWRRAAQIFPVYVRADLYQSEGSGHIGTVDGTESLSPGHWLHFRAVTNTGLPLSKDDYRVEWRVTNTDEAAFRARALRGEFYKPKADNSRWERLEYRGVHLVEAFVILKRNETLVGQSAPFRVIIE